MQQKQQLIYKKPQLVLLYRCDLMDLQFLKTGNDHDIALVIVLASRQHLFA